MNIVKYFALGIKIILLGITNFFRFFALGFYNVITFIPRYFIAGIELILGKPEKKSSKLMKNKKFSLVMMVLCVEVYLICIFFVSRWYVQGLKIKFLTNDIIAQTEIIEQEETNNQQEDITDTPTEEPINQGGETPTPDSNTEPNSTPTYYPNDYWDYMNVPFINVNFNELLSKNPDTVGWIKIDGIKVNYPVVQAEDNDYYLHHAFNKSSNNSGWIFADYRVNFSEFGKNTIIYGHNMSNRTMFGTVPQMLNSSYLNNSSNYFIKISTPTSNTVWKLFSIYTVEPEVYYLKTNFRTYSFEEFINTIKGRSIYNFGTEVTPDDKILTLSTCDNSGTKRIAVHAKMISIEYK